MAFFNRNNNNATISELEQYYEQQNRRNTSPARAWLMAILSILLTVLILAGLFYTGRWVYNRFTDNGVEAPKVAQQDANTGRVEESASNRLESDETDTSESDGDDVSSSGSVDNGAVSTTESNIDRVLGDIENENESSSNESAGSGSTDDTSSSSELVAGGASSEIPNTGAGQVGVFASITAGLLGFAISRKQQLKN